MNWLNKNCGDCKFRDKNWRCRRFPPQLSCYHWVFPYVDDQAWCWEYQPEDKPNPNNLYKAGGG